VSNLPTTYNLLPITYLRKLDSWIDNRIEDIGALAGLVNVRTLEADNNQVCRTDALAGMTSLKILSIQNNRISDISPLAGLAELSDLNLRNNQVMNVSPLTGLYGLVFLNLRNNPVNDEDIRELRSILTGCTVQYDPSDGGY
jgi:internalin A